MPQLGLVPLGTQQLRSCDLQVSTLFEGSWCVTVRVKQYDFPVSLCPPYSGLAWTSLPSSPPQRPVSIIVMAWAFVMVLHLDLSSCGAVKDIRSADGLKTSFKLWLRLLSHNGGDLAWRAKGDVADSSGRLWNLAVSRKAVLPSAELNSMDR